MINRLLKPLNNNSFFIFGARGTGKTTFIRDYLSKKESIVFDLLDPKLFDELVLDIDLFRRQIELEENRKKIIFVDEIQKLPKLLDIAQQLIVSDKRIFIFTGSSARRIKQASVNMLAGRAFVYHFFPFSSLELKEEFDLSKALERGLLPDSYRAESKEHSQEFLKSYILTYIEKEIQLEQWVRKLEPFRKFLEVAAQMSGKIINRASIAREIGVDDMTIASYYEILEDTLIGFTLPSFHRSVRKSQKVAPKFYLFDTGVKRALDRTLSSPLTPKTSAYGEAFEHFIIFEIMKLSSYFRLDWKFSYLRTKEDVEIDLIIDRPNKNRILVEIKSKSNIFENDTKSLEILGEDVDPQADRILISTDPKNQLIGKTRGLFWKDALKELFL